MRKLVVCNFMTLDGLFDGPGGNIGPLFRYHHPDYEQDGKFDDYNLKRLEAADLVRRTRSTEDERQVLIALTPKGQALKEKARAVPEGILAATNCSVAELSAMRKDLVALRDRLNVALGE